MTSGQVEEIQLFHRFHLTGEIPENTDDPKAIISCHVLLSRKLKKIGNFVKLMQLFPPKYRGAHRSNEDGYQNENAELSDLYF